ncbi:aminodeoxychorismate synthase component I [Cellulomonas sp. URHD0024]|uniref:aminodeoxychorismate synthase component I n=1 Tax=Cellulomonas sp. URHD0024 TaxID=1302620 RepID=UPI000417F807|nr:aminodeoxychorismate synthase component I [Cellulomonas sp. URHD0024]
MTRVLIVDNYDSFTYNLFQLVAEVCGEAPVVVHNDVPWETLDLDAFDAVILSPGPGTPELPSDVGICARLLTDTDLPVLGICLGHQLVGHLAGAAVVPANPPMHGQVSRVRHDGDELFADVPEEFDAVRYHSLMIDHVTHPLEVVARADDGTVMAVRHRERPVWGVQFHPESVLSEHGHTLIRNFLRLAGGSSDAAARYEVRSRRVAHGVSAVDLFDAFYRDDRTAFWLDSGGVGQFSILGSGRGVRAHTVSYRRGAGHVRVTGSDGTVTEHAGDLFSYLEESLARYAVPVSSDLPHPFALGYVGYLGYELRDETMATDVGVAAEHDDAHLVFAERALLVDHETGDVHALALHHPADDELSRSSQRWLDDLPGWIAAITPSAVPDVAPSSLDLDDIEKLFEPRHGRREYVSLVAECQDYIRRGESYELCLTNEFRTDAVVDPWQTYLRLRALSPVPYGAYLACGPVSVLSASPERFLTVSAGGAVETKPIKGTRPRGRSPHEDAELCTDLRTSVKDRAENLMIVDLLRNDLSTVCEIGSVHVPRLFHIETFPLVHQMVSTVRGQLTPGRSAVACTVAAFPGGSMTGAPKLRSVQILEKLEGGPRGVYSGALGWYSLTGAADLSIVIRTIVTGPGGTTFGVGGAVTALSDPDEEYVETLVKARGMATALVS